MRSAIVIEVNGNSHGGNDFLYASEHLSLKQLILHRVVDTFRLCVVLWVTVLCHTDAYTLICQRIHILTALMLTTTVGMMDEIERLAFNSLVSHPQGIISVYKRECTANTITKLPIRTPNF